jgi:hypothetical protein
VRGSTRPGEKTGSADLAERIKAFQFRDIRPKAASEMTSLQDASDYSGTLTSRLRNGFIAPPASCQADEMTGVAETVSATYELTRRVRNN